MFYICKNSRSTRKPYTVVLTAKNGEVLSHHSLASKQACWKNIFAQMHTLNCIRALVQDDVTQKYPVRYSANRGLGNKKDKIGSYPVYARYKSGKN